MCVCVMHEYAQVYKTPLSGPQNQHFNFTMRSVTFHKTSCMHILHFLERASCRIIAVCFVDIILRQFFHTATKGVRQFT